MVRPIALVLSIFLFDFEFFEGFGCRDLDFFWFFYRRIRLGVESRSGSGSWGSELGRSQQQTLAEKIASNIWGCISRSTTSRSKKIFIPLYPALTYTMFSLGKTSTCCSKLDGKAPRWPGWSRCPIRRGWESGACTDGGRGVFKATHSHPPMKTGDCEDIAALFIVVHCDRMSTNIHKLKKKRFKPDRRRNFSYKDSRTQTHWLEKSYWVCPWMFSEPSWIKMMMLAGGCFQTELSYAHNI